MAAVVLGVRYHFFFLPFWLWWQALLHSRLRSSLTAMSQKIHIRRSIWNYWGRYFGNDILESIPLKQTILVLRRIGR